MTRTTWAICAALFVATAITVAVVIAWNHGATTAPTPAYTFIPTTTLPTWATR